jgi:hypothetical protein
LRQLGTGLAAKLQHQGDAFDLGAEVVVGANPLQGLV